MRSIELITSYDDHNKVYHKTVFDVCDLDDITTTMREDFFYSGTRSQFFNGQMVKQLEPINIPWHENRLSDDSVQNYEYFHIKTSDIDDIYFDYYVAFPCYIDLYIKEWGSNIEIGLDTPFGWSPGARFNFYRSDYLGLSPHDALVDAMERIGENTAPLPEEYATKIYDALETYFDVLPEPDETEVI